jgi:hypothetical protein
VEAFHPGRAFTFTLVRNPWDRLLSYYQWLRVQSFGHPAVRLAKHTDFSGFLNAPQTQAALHAAPYPSYMTMADGQEHCRLYIRLECFEVDSRPLWEHLGFRLELPHSNASDRPADYRAAYTAADAALVAQLCAPDIARFGYSF